MSNNLPANVGPDLESEAKDLQMQTARDHVVNVIKATVSGMALSQIEWVDIVDASPASSCFERLWGEVELPV